MTTQLGRWEHFDHQADVGVRGIGPTLDAAFEQVALALTAVVTDPARVRPIQAVEIECEASRVSLLLVNWLNRLVYEMATRHMLFGRFEVHVSPPDLGGTLSLYARAWGEPVDPERHQPAVEVKGATYSELEVAKNPAGHWVVQCVVDV
ncbi:MAG: archease [Meiothermus sp.]|uniref:archease n=1 Tax=Meiothermus sp. TaxID=1955249 RepID=UPI0025D16187|nr:archease [Meiothermus sp.]MCS7067226.1 archease [Meiothermus sp.]MDW8426024.1 archease [Meiothermus sp.]